MNDKMDFTDTLAKNIKNLRKSKGLLLEQLAERVGISVSYLNRLEQGKRKSPSIKVVIKLAEIFGVTVDYLLLGENEKNDNK